MALNISLITPPAIEPLTLAQAQTQCRIDPGSTYENPLLTLYISAARQLTEKITRRAFFNQVWQRTLDTFPLATSLDYAATPADKWNLPVYGAMENRLVIDLPLGPVLAVNSITYTDYHGDVLTLPPSAYNADLTGVPCRLTPSQESAGATVWPFQGGYLPGSVNIQWQAASFILAASESFQVPNTAPFTYSLLQPSVTAIASILAGANPVTGWSASNGGMGSPTVLTLPAAQAGATLTVKYYVANLPADLAVAMLMLVAHFFRNSEATTDLTLKELPLGVQSLLSPYVIEWTDYRPC